MSRFGEWDEDEDFPNQYQFWQANIRRALKGKRGRRALAELREALMALPVHSLIEGALCTVGSGARREELYDGGSDEFRRFSPRAEFDAEVAAQGEGVCANGAYIWYRKVKAGEDPAGAFASLPTLYGRGEPESAWDTAHAAEEAGLAFPLAWHLAYRNDEEFAGMTPEERHAAFIAWIDGELARSAA